MTTSVKPRVLLIDDDDALRASLGRLLRRDLDVTLAPNGEEALALIEAGGSYDVILTNVVMPVMDGHVLLEQLTAISPAMAAHTVIMTGGSTDPALGAWLASLDSAVCSTSPRTRTPSWRRSGPWRRDRSDSDRTTRSLRARGNFAVWEVRPPGQNCHRAKICEIAVFESPAKRPGGSFGVLGRAPSDVRAPVE